jgi:RNAse (barnase) inhibitor barstar
MKNKSAAQNSKRKIFINGSVCNSREDFWNAYAKEIDPESAKHFGKNLDAFNDAISAAGPGYPGECTIEITGTENLNKIFGLKDFQFIIELLTKADFVDLITQEN